MMQAAVAVELKNQCKYSAQGLVQRASHCCL